MKKILIMIALFSVFTLVGCGQNKNGAEEQKNNLSQEEQQALTGETELYETVEIQGTDLANKVKQVNKDAKIEETINPGMSMLKVELPLEKNADLPKSFFKQVSTIVDKCGLKKNENFDYFYFSSSDENGVLVTVSFKFDNGSFVVDSILGISEEYKNAPEVAAGVSALFK